MIDWNLEHQQFKLWCFIQYNFTQETWANDPRSLRSPTIIHSEVGTVQDCCLTAGALHIVHRKGARLQNPKVRVFSWRTLWVSKHPAKIVFRDSYYQPWNLANALHKSDSWNFQFYPKNACIATLLAKIENSGCFIHLFWTICKSFCKFLQLFCEKSSLFSANFTEKGNLSNSKSGYYYALLAVISLYELLARYIEKTQCLSGLVWSKMRCSSIGPFIWQTLSQCYCSPKRIDKKFSFCFTCRLQVHFLHYGHHHRQEVHRQRCVLHGALSRQQALPLEHVQSRVNNSKCRIWHFYLARKSTWNAAIRICSGLTSEIPTIVFSTKMIFDALIVVVTVALFVGARVANWTEVKICLCPLACNKICQLLFTCFGWKLMTEKKTL